MRFKELGIRSDMRDLDIVSEAIFLEISETFDRIKREARGKHGR